ncbi:MAG: simple sugar transport system substrate-binding protein [Actinomycetota bacterium]|jgi:simple sugar transport system substrate-binding protein|nr:simple sugar transport system substrate-binding protein [Actinomycetota bacterium]
MSQLLATRTSKRLRRYTTVGSIASVIAVSVLLVSCSSTGSSSTSTSAPINDSAKGVSIVVVAGTSSDPFMSSVKHGVDAAALAVKAAGGSVTYLTLQNYQNLGPDTAKLAQTALNLHPTAIVVPDFVPSAEDPTLRSIVKAGITLVLYNSGSEAEAQKLGALTYIASDYEASGVAAGKELLAAGAKDVVFVDTIPGNPSADAMNNGYKSAVTSGGGKFRELTLPATSFQNTTAVTQAIKSELINSPSIDAIATWATPDDDSAAAAISQNNATGKVKLVGFGLSTNALSRIKAGTQLAATDQQPYAQGYYAVSAAFQYAAYGIALPTKLLTGPLVVDSKNVVQAIHGTSLGVR